MDSPAPLRGIALVALGTALLALSDATVKVLTERHPVAPVMAVRYGLNVALMLALYLPLMGRAMFRTRRTGPVLLRGAMLAAGSFCVGHALARMPVGETLSLVKLSPVLVLLAAGPLLGERVRPGGWVAVSLGFAGVLLIARPGGGLDPVGVAFALGAATAGCGYQLLSRTLAASESNAALLFWTAMTGSLMFGASLPWTAAGFAPGAADIARLALFATCASLGHLAYTAAFRYAPASLVSPMTYLQLVFAGGLGVLVWGHVPAPAAILGMVSIALAGITVALTARAMARRQARAATQPVG